MESIAIDGPAGVGKSTVATGLASKLGMEIFDSGAVYRAVGVATQIAGIEASDESAIIEYFKNMDITVKHICGVQRTFLNGEDITHLLKQNGMGERTTEIAGHPKVRRAMNKIFDKIGIKKGYVIEGRDIGTYMLPNAKVKFFLTASVEVRAKRRFDQYVASGEPANLEDIARAIELRDYMDTTRKVAPLKRAPDAVEIDSSDMSAEETIEMMLKIVEDKIKKGA